MFQRNGWGRGGGQWPPLAPYWVHPWLRSTSKLPIYAHNPIPISANPHPPLLIYTHLGRSISHIPTPTDPHPRWKYTLELEGVEWRVETRETWDWDLRVERTESDFWESEILISETKRVRWWDEIKDWERLLRAELWKRFWFEVQYSFACGLRLCVWIEALRVHVISATRCLVLSLIRLVFTCSPKKNWIFKKILNYRSGWVIGVYNTWTHYPNRKISFCERQTWIRPTMDFGSTR